MIAVTAYAYKSMAILSMAGYAVALLTYGGLRALVRQLHADDALIKLLDEADDVLVRLGLLKVF